ncbi:type ISP restriction/modification enzyme [Pontibacter sp. BAB1700]|uniref:type ISP restriction/modification enzyme n=1 Tax=Pontibacter sp. BAB1700 TaxID=1144253 RepID=UPI001ED8D70C|nr:type ISP restriction/modification enzyme [Pontibacter sp. BAB1700]
MNDDYVKFIRYGQHFVERNGTGVLAFINPHGFLDNPTFRGMRWHLLRTFDSIYTIDLHGNSKKKETAPDGSEDQNVFDIMQGVSINFFIKTGKKKDAELGRVYHADLYGKREFKYRFLSQNTLKTVNFTELKPGKPFLFFVPKNDSGKGEYEEGFKIDDLFGVNVTGIVTARDSLVISNDRDELLRRIQRFTDFNYTDSETRNHFFGGKKSGKYPAGDSRSWSLSAARRKIKDNDHLAFIRSISYRPFDTRSIYYSTDMVDWGREKYMQHFLKGDNVGLVIPKINKEDNCFFIADKIIAHKLCSAYDSNSIFPLYLYPEETGQITIGDPSASRTPNLNKKLVQQIADRVGLKFVPEREETHDKFSPLDLLDYIYAVLHSPSYREKYREFLKVDFPRVPFPAGPDSFWKLVELGGELRQVHLLESRVVGEYITQYPEDGSNLVEKLQYVDGNVYINDTQYFANVPQVVWEFYIGGYQPAQKWLKDRKGRELSFEDILHYQKIIVALHETDRLIKEVDKVGVEKAQDVEEVDR